MCLCGIHLYTKDIFHGNRQAPGSWDSCTRQRLPPRPRAWLASVEPSGGIPLSALAVWLWFMVNFTTTFLGIRQVECSWGFDISYLLWSLPGGRWSLVGEITCVSIIFYYVRRYVCMHVGRQVGRYTVYTYIHIYTQRMLICITITPTACGRLDA